MEEGTIHPRYVLQVRCELVEINQRGDSIILRHGWTDSIPQDSLADGTKLCDTVAETIKHELAAMPRDERLPVRKAA